MEVSGRAEMEQANAVKEGNHYYRDCSMIQDLYTKVSP